MLQSICSKISFVLVLGGTESQKISQALLYMITKDNMPLNSTEKDGLEKLLHTVTPLYKIPSRTTIVKMLCDKYDALDTLVIEKLNSVSWVTLTT